MKNIFFMVSEFNNASFIEIYFLIPTKILSKKLNLFS